VVAKRAGRATRPTHAQTASIASLADEPTPPIVPAARAEPDIFTELLQYGYSEDELFTLVIPKRTLARRRAAHEALTVEETDKAMRLRRIATQAQRVFGDPGKAHRWLRKPKRELNGETPIAFLASEEGARIVEEMLHRIDHGMAA
jgi:putative toxin-antitoxin system antitoxin component (TIGR02293 family)